MITKCNKCQPCCPGAISPIPATDDMKVPVGVRDGQLYTERQGIPEFSDSDVGALLEVKQVNDQTFAAWSKSTPQRIDDIEQKQTVDETVIDDLVEDVTKITTRYKEITLLVDDWVYDPVSELYNITVNATQLSLKTDSAVIVSPAVETRSYYIASDIVCVGQHVGSLDFRAKSIPPDDVDVNVIVINGEVH